MGLGDLLPFAIVLPDAKYRELLKGRGASLSFPVLYDHLALAGRKRAGVRGMKVPLRTRSRNLHQQAQESVEWFLLGLAAGGCRLDTGELKPFCYLWL
jgi:hypothetical protein